MPLLTIRDGLPEGFLTCPARALGGLFAGPTLMRLPGRRGPPMFVSVLLHGNEVSGLEAVQQVLRAHAGHTLPRGLLLLVGNVSAAAQGLRRLDGQPDYNRVWPGTLDHVGTAEAAAMAEVHRLILAERAFAAIDLHNNSGLNPHYGVVCSLDAASLHLATLFSRTAVWFRGLPGTQTAGLAGQVPAMAAECGKPGVPANAAAAARFVSAVLDMADFPQHPVRHQDIDLFHTLATVRVPDGVSMSFADEPADLRFVAGLDHLNFRELPAGARFGASSHPRPLEVTAEDGGDAWDEFFALDSGALALRRPAMPAMLTLDERIVRQDCLCYLMERVPAGMFPPGAID